ncbi:hemoblobin-interacting domain-containing protein [Anaerotignum faecicola]
MKNKGMYRLLSGVLCTSVLLSSQAYAAASADYSDFPQNWSKDAMEFAVKNNFITGVSEDKIAPKAALTRAQLAAILSRAMQTGAGDVSVLDNFTDADKNAWYAGAMAKAVELNILYGDGDSIYPDRPVTRQELFTILVRAFSVTGGDESTLASYNDAGSISSWAKAAISAMIAQGYAAGYEDKTLRPAQQVTREEFAQLLHRMREHYSSSDTSEDKTETKTDDTAKTDETTKTNTKKPSGGGGGGSSSGGGSHSSGGSVTVKKIVDETKATVQSTVMGAWLPLVFADGYDMSKATVTVDGTNATAAMTPVTTDGTIAKLALTGTPKQVVVAAGGKTQTITLNGSGTAAVYTGTGQYLPDYVLAHGAVATWDYHLTNYDKEGKPRVQPAKTTFDTKDEVNTHPYYAPDAVIAEDAAADNIYKVSGEVTIMFNYNTEAEKAWFDGIGNTVTLVANDGRYDSLGTLKMTKEAGVAHGRGKVGVLSIPVGQTNFYSNGRYYVRVKSTGGDKATTLVPIHLVNETVPVFKVKETATSGVNLHFSVENMTYGIKNPVERVTLTDPTGKTKTLRNIDDYYLLSQDLFVLYNDVTVKNGVNNIPYNGTYTMTVYSNGFKPVIKEFYVSGGKDAPTKQAFAVYQSAARDVDAVTHATGGSSGGGSSSDGSGGYMVSANLLFKSDLLVNALVLDKLGKATAASDKVVEDWYNMSGYDSLLNKGEVETYYKWDGYLDATNNTKVEKNDGAAWLPFAEYAKGASAETTPNRPYAVKEVLEDGLLGDVQHSNTYGRKEAPEVTAQSAKQGDAVVLKFAEKNHFGKVEKIFINGNLQELSTEKYSKDEENLTITIAADCAADCFKIGENTVGIDATGYVSKAVKVNYAKVNEENLSLTVEKADSLKEGNAVTIEITGSEGDFLKNLKGVVLNDGKTNDTVWGKGVEGSDAVYYVIADDKKSITLHNVKAGNYTLSLTAEYYDDAPLTTTFTVTAKDAETVTTPKFDSYELNEADGYYRVSFKDATGDELKAYLNSVEKVMVGSKEYTKQNSSIGNLGEDKFRVVASAPAYGSSEYDKLDLPASAVTKDEVTVVLKAKEGTSYNDVTFPIKKTSGGGGTEQPETKTAPVVNEITEKASDGIYEVSFKTEKAQDTRDYLAAITEVTVGGVPYEASENTPKSGSKQFRSKSQWLDLRVLQLGSGGFATDGKATKIVVKAIGYKDLVIPYGTDTTTPTEPTTKTAPKGTVAKENEYYQVSFAGDDAFEYIKAIKSVKVGDVSYVLSDEYTPTNNQFAKGSVITPVLKLGSAGFTGSGNITVTITATGYKENVVTYTMPNSGNSGGGTTAPGTPETPDNGGITVKECKLKKDWNDTFYEMRFNGFDNENDLASFVDSITEVQVGNDKKFTKATLSFSFSETEFVTVTENYSVGIKFHESSLADVKDGTTITIKGKVNGKDVTITYSLVKE